MAKTLRTPDVAASNWTQRASAAAGFYNQQVQASAWKVYAGSAQAEANYASQIQAAVAAKSRQNAINASSDEAWKAGVAAVGQARFGQGVTAAQPKMASVMSKLLPAIQAARQALPPRGPRGSAVNITQRGTGLQTALAKQKGTFKARGVVKSGG